MWRIGRVIVLATLAILGLFGTSACTSSPHQPGGETAETQPAPAKTGLPIPSTYQQACISEVSVCLPYTAGPIPSVLRRPLHLPILRSGQRCPTTQGQLVNTPQFGGIAVGKGPVQAIIAEEPAQDARRGIADLVSPTNTPPWLGFKTLWFSAPTYQGPFVIRAERLDHPGAIAMGEGPTADFIVVPPGPTLNSSEGWREAPGGTWVKSPGCYAWQVDGLTFSEVIVVQAVLKPNGLALAAPGTRTAAELAENVPGLELRVRALSG
jgi:hypothetical protein